MIIHSTFPMETPIFTLSKSSPLVNPYWIPDSTTLSVVPLKINVNNETCTNNNNNNNEKEYENDLTINLFDPLNETIFDGNKDKEEIELIWNNTKISQKWNELVMESSTLLDNI